MRLDIQIYSFIYSLLFGMFFSLLLELFNKLVCSFKIVKKSFFSFIFVFITSLCYFLGLLWINNGVLHIYFIVCLICGFIFEQFFKKWWLTHWRKK